MGLSDGPHPVFSALVFYFLLTAEIVENTEKKSFSKSESKPIPFVLVGPDFTLVIDIRLNSSLWPLCALW